MAHLPRPPSQFRRQRARYAIPDGLAFPVLRRAVNVPRCTCQLPIIVELYLITEAFAEMPEGVDDRELEAVNGLG